jgi:tetratricopeptide (TPR) repeat protein
LQAARVEKVALPASLEEQLGFRRAKFAGFALSILLSVYCGAQDTASGSKQGTTIAEVQTLIRSRQYDQALALTGADLEKTPADYRLWTLQGIALSLKGDTNGALTSFDKALHLSPTYEPALKGEVEILFRSGDKRAVPLLERILKATPNDLTAHEMLATLESRDGDCAAAAEQFESAADAIATHPESLEAYGYCLVEMKQFDKAVPVFEQLVSLQPDRTYPKYDLALVLVSAKQYETAIKTLEPLLMEDQKDPDILSLASQAYEATKDTPRAVALLRQAIVLSPTTPSYYAEFAALCLEHDSFQVGVDMMNVGLKYVHDDPSIYLARGLLYVELAEFDKAEKDFSKVEHLSSFQSLGSYALDMNEVQRNNPEQALAKVRSQLKTHPEDPLLNYFLAQLLMNQSPDLGSKEFKEAMSAALKTAKLKPDYVPVHDLLASIYMQAGQYSQAIDECHLALHYDPSDEAATYHLLISLKHSGHTEDLPALSKQISVLHRQSLQRENERKSFRLIEGNAASSPVSTGTNAHSP